MNPFKVFSAWVDFLTDPQSRYQRAQEELNQARAKALAVQQEAASEELNRNGGLKHDYEYDINGNRLPLSSSNRNFPEEIKTWTDATKAIVQRFEVAAFVGGTPNPVLAHSAKPSRFAFSVNAGPVPFERLASEREFIFRMLESDADGLVDSDTAMCALAEIETSMTVVPVLGTSDAAKRLSVALETMSRFESLEDDSLEAKLIGSVINWLQGGLS